MCVDVPSAGLGGCWWGEEGAEEQKEQSKLELTGQQTGPNKANS